jgi:hypothetical protein
VGENGFLLVVCFVLSLCVRSGDMTDLVDCRFDSSGKELSGRLHL